MHTYHTRMAVLLVATQNRQLEREYTYTRADVVLNAEGGTNSALWLLRGDSNRLFSKTPQVKTVHDKSAYILT